MLAKSDWRVLRTREKVKRSVCGLGVRSVGGWLG